MWPGEEEASGQEEEEAGSAEDHHQDHLHQEAEDGLAAEDPVTRLQPPAPIPSNSGDHHRPSQDQVHQDHCQEQTQLDHQDLVLVEEDLSTPKLTHLRPTLMALNNTLAGVSL